MPDACEQGKEFMSEMRGFISSVKKEMAEDRLTNQKHMGESATKIEVMAERIGNFIDKSDIEIKACKESRTFIHKRINKIWGTGVSFLLAIIAAFISIFVKNHSGH